MSSEVGLMGFLSADIILQPWNQHFGSRCCLRHRVSPTSRHKRSWFRHSALRTYFIPPPGTMNGPASITQDLSSPV